MRYKLVKAIILRKQASNENDWYLTLFSPELGKIQAISRSSRKISSRKGSHLDPLNLCQFQLYKKNDRYLVTECKVENAFLGIKNDLNKSLIAFTVLELLIKSLQSESSTELFNLTLNSLNKLLVSNNPLILEDYKIKLLVLAGSLPQLHTCHTCEQKFSINETKLCYSHEGDIFCHKCRQQHEHANSTELDIGFKTVKLAHNLAQQNFNLPLNLIIDQQELFELKRLVNLYMANYLHQEIYSEKLLLS